MKTAKVRDIPNGSRVYYGANHYKDARASYEAGAPIFVPLMTTALYTSPAEYFRDYPDATSVEVGRVEDGELCYGAGTFFRSELSPEEKEFADELEAKAQALPVVTADTHEPVPGENFRRRGRQSPPAIVQAKRRAVALGYEAVICHTLPNDKYGMRWSPARPKSP